MTTGEPVSLEARIEGALGSILSIYGVPEETRKLKIKKVFALDYRKMGRRVLKDFKKFVEKTNEKAISELLKSR